MAGNTEFATTFLSLNFFVFCQITDFSNGTRVMEQAVLRFCLGLVIKANNIRKTQLLLQR
jgi:hypothetical protein